MEPREIDNAELRPPAVAVVVWSALRGRKRKAGGRKPSGQLRYPSTDHGSSYGAIQRLARTSCAAAADAIEIMTDLARLDGQPDLSREDTRRLRECRDFADRLPRQARDQRLSYPLGILYATRQISSGRHYAGRRYAALFVAAVRPVSVPSILADLMGHGSISGYRPDMSGTGRQQIEIDYRDARQALSREGIRVVRIVDEVVVYEDGMPASGSPRMRWLETGLGALADHFERADTIRRAAGA